MTITNTDNTIPHAVIVVGGSDSGLAAVLTDARLEARGIAAIRKQVAKLEHEQCQARAITFADAPPWRLRQCMFGRSASGITGRPRRSAGS